MAAALVAPWRGDGRCGPPGDAAGPRAAPADAGPPRAARAVPLAAPVRDPVVGRPRVRRAGRRVPRDPPHRAVAARDRRPARPVAGRRAAHVPADPARPRRGGRGGHATTAAQGRILLRRQFAQLPRWLGQARYNGPPPTHGGALVAKPRDYASNPQISARRLAASRSRRTARSSTTCCSAARSPSRRATSATARRRRRARAALPARPRRSAVVVQRDHLRRRHAGGVRVGGRQPELRQAVRRHRRVRPRPVDGAGVAEPAGAPEGVRRVAIGVGPGAVGRRRHVVYQAVDDAGRVLVRVADLTAGDARTVVRATAGMTPFEPDISADGSRVAYTARRRTRSRIEVVDVATGETTPVPVAPGRSRRSPTCRPTASTWRSSRVRPARRRRAFVECPRRRSAHRVRVGEAGALRPVTSADGGVVAYTEVTAGDPAACWCATSRAATTEVVSRAGADGAEADRPAGDASISDDGNRIAFVSAATNLDAGQARRHARRVRARPQQPARRR